MLELYMCIFSMHILASKIALTHARAPLPMIYSFYESLNFAFDKTALTWHEIHFVLSAHFHQIRLVKTQN